jgi:hypothetical protein
LEGDSNRNDRPDFLIFFLRGVQGTIRVLVERDPTPRGFGDFHGEGPIIVAGTGQNACEKNKVSLRKIPIANRSPRPRVCKWDSRGPEPRAAYLVECTLIRRRALCEAGLVYSAFRIRSIAGQAAGTLLVSDAEPGYEALDLRYLEIVRFRDGSGSEKRGPILQRFLKRIF